VSHCIQQPGFIDGCEGKKIDEQCQLDEKTNYDAHTPQPNPTGHKLFCD
jgi:hypothetical protein